MGPHGTVEWYAQGQIQSLTGWGPHGTIRHGIKVRTGNLQRGVRIYGAAKTIGLSVRLKPLGRSVRREARDKRSCSVRCEGNNAHGRHMDRP